MLLALLPGLLRAWVLLVAREPGRWDVREHARGLAAIFGKRGFLTRPLRNIRDFHREGFHPAERDTTDLEAKWREALFGAEGTLAKQVA